MSQSNARGRWKVGGQGLTQVTEGILISFLFNIHKLRHLTVNSP